MKSKEEIRKQTEEIIAGLTDEQKVAQISCMFCGDQLPTQMLLNFPNGFGEIAVMPGKADTKKLAAEAEEQQEIIKSQCGIPALRHNEAVTGLMTPDGSVFPLAIGLGASWDPQMVERMGDLIRKQTLASGIRHVLSPVMDVARDPRWGRVGETYGEDPTLCAAMSTAFTRGVQTDDLENGILATGKHFLGYAMGEGGLNMASGALTDRELKEVYAKPFQAAITEAHLGSVMNSYGSIDGELIVDTDKYLTKLLRKEMGFDGVVVSDYMSTNKIVELKLSENPVDAGARALRSGLDCELPTPFGYHAGLLEAVNRDQTTKKAFDRAVEKIVEAKVKLGLFDNHKISEEELNEAFDRESILPLLLKAARESIVLLRNDGILPLKKEKKKIAVIGPHADSLRLLYGYYTYPAVFDRDTSGSMSDMPGMQDVGMGAKENPYQMPFLKNSNVRGQHPYIEEYLKEILKDRTVTILDALKDKDTEAEFVYVKGCEIAGDDRSGFEEAVKAASEADLVIVTGGGKSGWGSNCTTGEGIDTDRIGLPGVQEELAIRIRECKKPCIYIHLDAKPLSSEYISENYNAVLEIWFPGEAGGRGLADVLYGDYNPAGRLPMTAARHEGQIPIYHSQRKGNGYYDQGFGMVISKYAGGSKLPIHYFGEGLSYSSFEYSNLSITEQTSSDGKIKVQLTVTNTSDAAGDEVVQVYVTDEISSMIRPAEELAGFFRVHLEAGESKKLEFEMKADQFAFLDKNMKWIVEAGKMTVRVGASSKDIRLSGTFEITDTKEVDCKNRGFYAYAKEIS